MKNSRKYKRRRAIIMTTALLILLFGALLIFGNINKDTENNNQNNVIEPNVPGEPKGEENKEENKEENDENIIIDITVSPSNYTVYSGEIIDLDIFKVEKVNKSGKTEGVNLDEIEITTDSEFIKIENNSAIVSDYLLTKETALLSINLNGIIKNITINILDKTESNTDENYVITNTEDYDVLVNKKRNLPSDYVPKDLVALDDVPTVLPNPEINQLREAAYDALKELFEAAMEEENYSLFARSGYRSYDTQDALYSAYVANYGQEAADKFSAKPGQSEHQTGLAMDITTETMNYVLDITFGETIEGKWVQENAHRFGFIVRYPLGKEDITGYQYEPWHIRYVGKDLAKEIYESELTMEEYFQ